MIGLVEIDISRSPVETLPALDRENDQAGPNGAIELISGAQLPDHHEGNRRPVDRRSNLIYRAYCNSAITPCDDWFAFASTEVPACCMICERVMFDTSVA